MFLIGKTKYSLTFCNNFHANEPMYGATPVKKNHSAVPHENSAFKNFACKSLILYCEHISPI